jgi:hypothetical protein
MTTPRAVSRGLASGHVGTLAVPLALHVSARIAERDPEDFLYDPTELANALRDLIEAVGPDGVPVSDPEVLLAGCRSASDVLASQQLGVALEAVRRLRAFYADAIALVAMLPGPAALAESLGADRAAVNLTLVGLGQEFLGAGADVIVVHDEQEMPGVSLTTLSNVARFHQAIALSHGAERYGLATTTVEDFDSPRAATGVVLTRAWLPRDTDITRLSDWITAVRI